MLLLNGEQQRRPTLRETKRTPSTQRLKAASYGMFAFCGKSYGRRQNDTQCDAGCFLQMIDGSQFLMWKWQSMVIFFHCPNSCRNKLHMKPPKDIQKAA